MLVEVVLPVVVALVVVGTTVRMWYVYTSGRCSSTRSMAGKTVIITGGTAGIGKETARDLLRRGARVILACRNLEKAAKVVAELQADVGGAGEVVVRRLDTSDLASVRTFAKEVLEAEKAIHVLINNAGILGPRKRQVTADGLELTMATNHFGHFLLTNLLLGVTVNSLHPGIVRTSIFDTLDLGTGTPFINLMLLVTSKDAVSGAQTTIHLAVSEEVEDVTGRYSYFADCKETPTSELACRKDLATGLWEASFKAVGLQQHETLLRADSLPPATF